MKKAFGLIWFMHFITGVFEVAKESILHPLSGSKLVETPDSGSGYVAIRQGADLSRKTIRNYDLRGVSFKDVNLDGTVFENCDIDEADLKEAKNKQNAKFVGKTPILDDKTHYPPNE